MADTPDQDPVASAESAGISSHRHEDALPEGTRLGEFEIRRVVGVGGFGIVYLAFDHGLQRPIALKEYFPSAMAGRRQGGAVTARSSIDEETFTLGIRSFINEGRLLAQFDHPSLVKVFRFWESNGTAYMVMPYYKGRTFKQLRSVLKAPPDETWLRGALDALLGALELLHAKEVFHRDVAPDNVLVTEEGLPVLLDFGAARREVGDHTQHFTAILKPNFAPIEQYADATQMRQGPWTDLYALAATIYHLLTGRPPRPAAARMLQDDLPLLADLKPVGCSVTLLRALDWALAVRPPDRPQSVAVFRDALAGRIIVPKPRRDAPAVDIAVEDMTESKPSPSDVWHPAVAHAAGIAARRAAGFSESVTMDLSAATIEMRPTHASSTDLAVVPSQSTMGGVTVTPAQQPSKRPRWAWILAGTALVFVLGAGLHKSRHRTPDSAQAVVQQAPAPVAAMSAARPAVIEAEAPAPAQARGASATMATAAAAPAKAAWHGKVAATSSNGPARQAPQQPPQSVAQAQMPARTSSVDARVSPPVPAPVQVEDKNLSSGAPVETRIPTPAPGSNEPMSPRRACGARVFMALKLCMEQECEMPRFRNHPQCLRLREWESRGQEPVSNGEH